LTAACQRCDSGTSKLIQSANRAGTAPANITQRQESGRTGTIHVTRPIVA